MAAVKDPPRTQKVSPRAVVDKSAVVVAGAGVMNSGAAVVDVVDGKSGNAKALAQAMPYGQLAALGAFKGLVSTPSGDVHVEIIPGKNVGQRPPIVFLDGLDACGRSVPTDETVVRIDLHGQLHTLAHDIKKNGARSIGKDIDPQAQVDAVVGALDALGIDKPVHILGLSYGGMIAAMTKKAHPERVEALLLCSPYVHTTGIGDPARDLTYALLMKNPFNPFGEMLYRAAARATLAAGIATVPPALWGPQAALYPEAMYRMSMGLEGKHLADVIDGMSNVNVLSAFADPLSPPTSSKPAHNKAASGTFEMAPALYIMQHDLVRMAPALVRRFIENSLAAARGATT
jgi:pimeloyl-ACP methyl ester carboxylesterase